MIFLPIAERELRAASRKRSTFFARLGVALAAILISGGFMGIGHFSGGAVAPGSYLFSALAWMSFAVALFAGVFFTSDCLSQEKREGTIGFLFLTQLRGYDVVAGKLLASSLRASYALLALFPIMAVSLLMGGVAAAQFWRTSLTLMNGLFVSLTVALFVSALSRDSQKAAAGTLVFLTLLVAGGPASDSAFAAISGHGFKAMLSLTSPGYLFVSAQQWAGTSFWPSLIVNQVEGWFLFCLAALLLPRIWQERGAKISSSPARTTQRRKFSGATKRAAFRGKLLEINPVLWLTLRDRWQKIPVWVLGATIIAGVTILVAIEADSSLWFSWNSLTGSFSLPVYLLVASQSGRFFVEARRSGLLELLLATPLPAREIVRGYWRSLTRMFAAPVFFFCAAQMVGKMSAYYMINVSVGSVRPKPEAWVGFVMPLLITLGNLATLGWVGMWMGHTSRNNNIATLKTILLVQVIPWFVISFASVAALLSLSGFMSGAPGFGSNSFWLQLLPSALVALSLGKDAGFVLWARRHLYREFRERAARSTTGTDFPLPPIILNNSPGV